MPEFQVQNPNWRAATLREVEKQSVLKHLQMEIPADGLAPGVCHGHFIPGPAHTQQDGFVHAGILATLADTCGGFACLTLAPAGTGVLSIEFKINMLRPSGGDKISCEAKVLKPGRNVSIAESWVYSHRGGDKVLSAKLTVTIALVGKDPA